MKKKFILVVLFLLLVNLVLFAQLIKPVLQDSLFSTYFHQRVTLFRSLPQTKEEIIFLGNSIMDGGELSEGYKQ
jgi:hexosaminidase